MSELSVHHVFLTERGWTPLGSNYYQHGTRIYTGEEAHEIESARIEFGIGSKKIKIIKGGESKPKPEVVEQTNGGVQPVEQQDTEQTTENEGSTMKVIIKPWDEKDITRLKDLFPTKTLAELAKELNRPEGSVRNKIWALRLKKSGKSATPKVKVVKPKAEIVKPKTEVVKPKKTEKIKKVPDLKLVLALSKKLTEAIEQAMKQ